MKSKRKKLNLERTETEDSRAESNLQSFIQPKGILLL